MSRKLGIQKRVKLRLNGRRLTGGHTGRVHLRSNLVLSVLQPIRIRDLHRGRCPARRTDRHRPVEVPARETLGGFLLPALLRLFLPAATADGAGASLASMSVYILMAAVLVWRPHGLFPAHE